VFKHDSGPTCDRCLYDVTVGCTRREGRCSIISAICKVYPENRRLLHRSWGTPMTSPVEREISDEETKTYVDGNNLIRQFMWQMLQTDDSHNEHWRLSKSGYFTPSAMKQGLWQLVLKLQWKSHTLKSKHAVLFSKRGRQIQVVSTRKKDMHESIVQSGRA